MNKVMDLFEFVVEKNGPLTAFALNRLGLKAQEIAPVLSLGIALNQKLVGVVVLSDLKPNFEVWLSIYTLDKRWCTRRVLRQIFGFVFHFFNCKRASLLVSANNKHSLNFVQRLGFQKEGCLRCYGRLGEDVFLFSLLRSECKFL